MKFSVVDRPPVNGGERGRCFRRSRDDRLQRLSPALDCHSFVLDRGRRESGKGVNVHRRFPLLEVAQWSMRGVRVRAIRWILVRSGDSAPDETGRGPGRLLIGPPRCDSMQSRPTGGRDAMTAVVVVVVVGIWSHRRTDESPSGLRLNVLLQGAVRRRQWILPSGMDDAGPGLGRPRSKRSFVFPLRAEPRGLG